MKSTIDAALQFLDVAPTEIRVGRIAATGTGPNGQEHASNLLKHPAFYAARAAAGPRRETAITKSVYVELVRLGATDETPWESGSEHWR